MVRARVVSRTTRKKQKRRGARKDLNDVMVILSFLLRIIRIESEKRIAFLVGTMLERITYATIRSTYLTIFGNSAPLHANALHTVFVHYLLGVAGCSKVGRLMVSRVRRSITLEVLTNVPRLLRGDRALRPEDNFRNPINAILAFQVMCLGFHQGARACAAFSRDCYSDADTLALVDNRLPKSGEEPNAPIARSLSQVAQGVPTSNVRSTD